MATFDWVTSSCVFISSSSGTSSSFLMTGAVNFNELFNGGGGGASGFLNSSCFTSAGGSFDRVVTSVISSSASFFGATKRMIEGSRITTIARMVTISIALLWRAAESLRIS